MWMRFTDRTHRSRLHVDHDSHPFGFFGTVAEVTYIVAGWVWLVWQLWRFRAWLEGRHLP